ncbi:MAG: oligosaccharide flippase family protein [Pseudomonadota bacterium]
MREIYQKFRAGLRAHTLAKVLVQAVSWIGTVYVLRTLDAHAVGLFAIASVAFGYASLMYEGGMLETLVQQHPATRDERRSVFSLLLAMGVGSAAVLAVLAQPIATLVDTPEVAAIIAVLAVNLVTIALGILPHARLIHDMRFAPLAVISSVQALVSAVTMIALASMGEGVWSLVWSQMAGALVRTVMLNAAVPSLHAPTVALASALRYLRTSSILIADGLLFRWYTSVDVFLLGRWSGAAQLGNFSFGQQVANTPLEKISTVVNDVSLPAYASLAAERGAAGSLMLETMRTHGAIGLPVFWGIASVALTAVPVIFGAQWLPAVFPLVAMALVAPLRLIGSVETPAMTGIGRAFVLLQTKLIIVPVMTVALVAGAWWGGVRGVSLAWMVAFPPVYAFAFRLVLRAIGLRYAQVLAALRGPAIAAAIMGVTVSGLQYWAHTQAQLPPVVQLLALIACGASLYPAALWIADRQAFSLLRQRAQLLVSGH